MRVLVVNTGSSSLKLSVLEPGGDLLETATIERWAGAGDLDPLTDLLERTGSADAVGHRVVHGGDRYTEAAPVDQGMMDYLDSIAHLAPSHNPRAVAGMRAVAEILPDVPAVACFDTAFHSKLPRAASTYALPRAWNEQWGLRRFGFHGLSHAYAVRRAAQLAARTGARTVSCHLGAGASLAAVRDGVCVDTTMGFTPLEGLVMSTRAGSVDPGLLLWLLGHAGVELEELVEALEHRSGLSGLTGTTGDMRDVLAGVAEESGDCALALDVFIHRLCREIAAMTASLGGLDLLVLTGGIGEHAWQVRAAVAHRLSYMGTALDDGTNRRTSGDGDISAPGAVVTTVVVSAREDVEIAGQVAALLT
ncbi:MAG: acetate/propionate family kinase [Actinomycetota bacterium]